ncbi:Predicted metalloprotease [Nocardia amikacinitolerans]|uniref:Predicted metalloprotease n=1 Tax=Nocardia amikacinitolerans TaxID=756689 RepID=A0A285LQ76_9NOCA|nr:metallopeptidase [Nocardia amikacinitolerans]MCP2298504.1 putative metalloprotease [Nocardia amikacinitolerans]SNY85531.1 Predicted metalloprotease [Nocardia amikacinitolerans]
MRTKRLRFAAIAVLVAIGATLAGCGSSQTTTSSENAAATDPNNPWMLAGAASNTGPSGPRPGVPDTTLTAENGDGGPVDQLALNAIADIEEFWKAEYAKTFPGTFEPVNKYISWDARAPKEQSVKFCKTDTHKLVNAAYCGLDHTIGWDRRVLLPLLEDKYGPMSVVMVLAHEYGHAIQGQAKIAGLFTGGLVKEQQADCLAGVFLRHVAEGDSPHFTMNMTDGLDGVLGATIAVRDTDPSDPDNVHGSAFERVTAVQLGYTDGAEACKRIDRKEIEQRRGGLPVTFEVDDEESQQLPVDQASLTSVSQALLKNFPIADAPQFDYTGVVRNCSKVTTTEPVSYCPSSNKIGTDIPELAERGGPLDGDDEPLSAVVQGDYNAFVVFVSRYMLAVQQDRKLSLTGAETAGLRTACLSGAFTTKLSEPTSDPRLSANDLDEAVSGLLADGLAAADVDGKVVKSGYQRLEAFRTGVLDGEQACMTKFK